MSDRELPTVSVLVPARNEDMDLQECLKSLVANDYPKLEIIVLDDCSQDSRIPEIVKEFAQDGVRFIPGETPELNWLSKNQAYRALANAASGEWLLFMGVDVRLGIGSVRALITQAIHEEKSMVSIMPTRYGGAYFSGFIAPLRYLWEIALPRDIVKRPPVLSTVWLIKNKALKKFGGLEAVARTVIPEGYFSRELAKSNQYAFLRTNSYLQIQTAKNITEQFKTAVRTRYPQVHKRMEWTALQSLGIAIFMILPTALLVSSIWVEYSWYVIALAAISTGSLLLSHITITTITNPVMWPLSLVNLPYLLLQEIVIINYSMYQYEFGEVIWKGRNICLPVMHVYPHLPKID